MGTIDSFLDLELCEVVHDSDNEPRERKRGQLKVTFKGVDQDLSTCACGTEFPLDAAYCRRCGKAAPPADVTMQTQAGRLLPVPRLAVQRRGVPRLQQGVAGLQQVAPGGPTARRGPAGPAWRGRRPAPRARRGGGRARRGRQLREGPPLRA
ncbi:unnamed protein product [Prorocentrum cordatum]|uniref:Uncharacterized protein n=1 Tax=Prorocentrum cordatum TaxID=2364126 RepID=A0ABN9QDK6_9DINO|nr:unnamed protein product [Polarella glacialis]